MRLFIIFYTLLFSTLTYSATCDNYQINYTGQPSVNPLAASLRTTKYLSSPNNYDFRDVVLNDIMSTGHFQTCYLTNGNSPYTCSPPSGLSYPESASIKFSFNIVTNQCFEELEKGRECQSKGANGGTFLFESREPQICANGCIAYNMGGSQPIFGHITLASTNSVFAYSGIACSNPSGMPNHDLADETGAGESCTLIDGLQFCNVPDIDGNGLPDLPAPEQGELGDGCMSVTNLANSNSSLICGDPFGGDDANDPNTRCGFVGSVYQCVPTDECTFVNGSAVCLDENGAYVGTDSPDNPLNGGNLDGNTSNDLVPNGTSISSPLLSQDELIGSQHDANLLTENLAPYLANINDSVLINGQKIDNSNVLLTSIASGITDLNNKDFGGGTGIDETLIPSAGGYQMQVEQDTLFTELDTTLTDGTGDGSKGDELATNADSFKTLLGITLDSGCVDVSYPIYNDHTFTIKCSWANYTSAILTWVFWFFTVYSVMMIALNTTSKV